MFFLLLEVYKISVNTFLSDLYQIGQKSVQSHVLMKEKHHIWDPFQKAQLMDHKPLYDTGKTF